MKKFREFLKEQLKDKEFEKAYYEGLEKARIALEITYFREKKGLTQAELAKQINTSQSAIARLENPDYKGYSLNTLRNVAKALGLELVVSFREKGVEIYEKEPSKVLYVTPWPKEKKGYTFRISSEVITEPKKELVA